MSDEIKWSDWLDFSETQAQLVPEDSGVYMMHAAMKILFIGGSKNLRNAITEALKSPCTSESKRFRYFVTDSYDDASERIISEYREKHDGKMPKCME